MTNADLFKIISGMVCCVGVPVGFLGLAVLLQRRDKAVVREGQTLFAALVQANNKLFSPGEGSAPAQVLICFDPDTPVLRRKLLEIAARFFKLKTDIYVEPEWEQLAEDVRDERARFNKPYALPLRFTGGLTVYAVTLWIDRDLLPGKILDRKFVYCRAKPEEPGRVVMISDTQADTPRLPK